MITYKEALLRLSQSSMRLQTKYDRSPDEKYCVTFGEARSVEEAEKSAYYTDDLLDAVITGSNMRRNKGCA